MHHVPDLCTGAHLAQESAAQAARCRQLEAGLLEARAKAGAGQSATADANQERDVLRAQVKELQAKVRTLSL